MKRTFETEKETATKPAIGFQKRNVRVEKGTLENRFIIDLYKKAKAMFDDVEFHREKQFSLEIEKLKVLVKRADYKFKMGSIKMKSFYEKGTRGLRTYEVESSCDSLGYYDGDSPVSNFYIVQSAIGDIRRERLAERLAKKKEN